MGSQQIFDRAKKRKEKKKKKYDQTLLLPSKKTFRKSKFQLRKRNKQV